MAARAGRAELVHGRRPQIPSELDRGAGRADQGDRRQVPRPSAPCDARPRSRSTDRRRAGLSWTSAWRAGPASSPARAAGSAARRRDCSAPRAPRCCSSPARGERLAAAGASARRAGGAGKAAALELDVTDPDAGERMLAEANERFGALDVLVNNAGDLAVARPRRGRPTEDWQAAWELNVMAPLRAMRAAIPGMARARLGAGRQRLARRGQAPSANMRRVLGRQGGRAVAVAPVRRPPRRRRRARQRDLPRPDGVGAVDGAGRPARPVAASRRARRAARRRWRRPGQAPDRPARRGRRDRRGDRLPVLGARLLRRRRRLARGRRHRPGDHLGAWMARLRSRRCAAAARRRPRPRRWTPTARPTRRCWCRCSAGPTRRAWSSPSAAPTCAATRARSRFPAAAATSPEEDLLTTALREAEEEIGLDPATVELVGALPPVGTFVTNYKVHPFVGLIPDGARLEPNPAEVAAVLRLRLDELREGFAMRGWSAAACRSGPRPTRSSEHLIWGATARILGELLLERLEPRSLDVLLDRHVDQVAPLGPGAVVVLDVAVARAARGARTRCGPSARRSGSRR